MSPSRQSEVRFGDSGESTDEDLAFVNFGSDVILQMRSEGAVGRLSEGGSHEAGLEARPSKRGACPS